MVSYTWTTGRSGEWNTAANWTPAAAPNNAIADVTIDAAATAGAYTVTIAAGAADTVNSLSMNAATNLLGSIARTYDAARLELDGTLVYAPGSPGLLGGSLQTNIHTGRGSRAEILNPGTLNGFIQAEGNLLLTGTNGLYVTNWLQALASTVTVDTRSIAEMAGTTLFDGIYEAQGPSATVNLGGPLQHLAVNIATVEGPPLIPDGWTELIMNGPDANTKIQEWNGTAYVGLETTLRTIANRGTVDVLGGRGYATANALTVTAGGLLNLQLGTVTAAAIDINGGTVQGFGTIAGNVANNGSLVAVGGALDVTGNVTGTGTIGFDYDQRLGQTVPGGATAEFHTVAAGQSVVMNGDDTLQLDAPAAFAGTVSARAGDKIVLKNDTVTAATIRNGVLTFSNGGSLALSGSYAGEHFNAVDAGGDTTLTLVAGTQTTAPSSEFDPAYYLAHNPDVAAAHLDPYAHYEQYGWKEGRNPDAVFDVKYYLNQNPDVAAAHVDPLTQYEQFGWREGRDPSSTFSTQSYLQANPDVAAAHADPLQHYLRYGAPEGRMAFLATPHAVGPQNPLVDNNYYFSQYADVRAAGVNPFTQYDSYGWKEGRNPSADFSTSKYLAANPDVRAAGIDPLLHYEQYGMHEGRAIYHT